MVESCKPCLYQVLDRVCVGQNLPRFQLTAQFCCFQMSPHLDYEPFCDYFGPMNLKFILRFIRDLDTALQSHPSRNIVCSVSSGRRAFTNAVFLLGAYMILRLNRNLQATSAAFAWLDQSMIEPFRDSSISTPNFGLSLFDCWQGLESGYLNGWVHHDPEICQLDLHQYSFLDSPLNADMHVLVPGKLIAFRGPLDIGDLLYADDAEGIRRFSPRYYSSLLQCLGVSTVIRLSSPEYDREEFIAAGFRHYDLPVADGALPPDTVVGRFLQIVDAAPDPVAVHCRAGLGRTGALAALYLMRSCGFTARAAIGWLRIVRPGSVVGKYQLYLCRLCDSEGDGEFACAGRGPAARRDADLGVGRDGPAVRPLCAAGHILWRREQRRLRLQAASPVVLPAAGEAAAGEATAAADAEDAEAAAAPEAAGKEEEKGKGKGKATATATAMAHLLGSP